MTYVTEINLTEYIFKISTMNKKILTLLLLLFISLAGSGNSLPEQKADSLVKLSLQADQPGGIVVITHRGKTILNKAYGMADIEQGLPNTRETLFNTSSVSKQFTAFAILLLEKQGKLKLDDNIHTYLPDLPDYGHKITIRHLIHHTSGLPSTDILRIFSDRSLEDNWSHDDELDLICSYTTLNFPPGEQYVYSNSGYSLLASIIEKVSQMRYSDYLEKNIFHPLGMRNTFVYDKPGKQIPGKGIGYKKQEDGFIAAENSGDASYGGSNIFTTGSDMARWGQNYFEPKVGNQKMLNQIFRPEFVLNNGDTIDYSFGLNVSSYKGMKLVSHSGGDISYRSQFWIFPEHEVMIFAAFNTDGINTRNLVAALVDDYLKDYLQVEQPKERVPRDIDVSLLKSYEGTYRMDDGMDLGFVLERDTFWLVIPEAPHFQLFAESENHFFLKAFDAQVTFVGNHEGQAEGIIWHQGGKDYPANRAGEVEMPDADQIAEYAGRYYHNELDVEYPVDLSDGMLILSTPSAMQRYLNIDKVTLIPMGDDRFMSKDSPLGVIKFTRNKNNEVDGFIIADVGRLKNFTLSKR